MTLEGFKVFKNVGFPWTYRGILLGYHAVIWMTALLVFAFVLPQMIAAGYQDAIPLLTASRSLVSWGIPILQIAFVLGVAWTMSAPSSSKVFSSGVACLGFTILVYVWPSIVYLANLPRNWLYLNGGFGFPAIVPFIQAWLFSGLLWRLSQWGYLTNSINPRTSGTESDKITQDWGKAVLGFKWITCIGALYIAIWLFLYYLPAYIPILTIRSAGLFRLWLLLPQAGLFLILIMLAGFSRPVSRLLGLLSSHEVYDDFSQFSTAPHTTGLLKESFRQITWLLAALAFAAIVSYPVGQRWLAPMYAEMQLKTIESKIGPSTLNNQIGQSSLKQPQRPTVPSSQNQKLVDEVLLRYMNDSLLILPKLLVYGIGVILSFIYFGRFGKPAIYALTGSTMLCILTAVSPLVQGVLIAKLKSSRMNQLQLASYQTSFVLVLLHCIAFCFILAAIFSKRVSHADQSTE